MQLENSKIYLKFYEPLDIFIKVKSCSEHDLMHFIDKTNGISKNQYIIGLIKACFPEYHEQIKPHLEALQNHSDPMMMDEMNEDLYQLCLQVNPHLHISKVSLKTSTTPPSMKTQTSTFKDIPIKTVEEQLKKEVIGQDKAIQSICHSLKRAFIGINDNQRPVGSFLLVGNTGVGKTQLAKSLANILFDDDKKLIRIDCSEYSQGHESAKLIGSPPGYVGHEEGGVLTKAVSHMKQAVVLFDEIEKADTKVHHMLLQIIDEGRLTNSQGETVSFNDCVIIMTSNLGLKDSIRSQNGPGFSRVTGKSIEKKDHKAIVTGALHDFFSPEFLNRIDNTVHFNNLCKSNCLSISNKFLNEMKNRIQKNGFYITFDSSIAEKIVELGFNERFGAREIKRQIQKFVENPLSDEILNKNILKGDHFIAEVTHNGIHFKKTA